MASKKVWKEINQEVRGNKINHYSCRIRARSRAQAINRTLKPTPCRKPQNMVSERHILQERLARGIRRDAIHLNSLKILMERVSNLKISKQAHKATIIRQQAIGNNHQKIKKHCSWISKCLIVKVLKFWIMPIIDSNTHF